MFRSGMSTTPSALMSRFRVTRSVELVIFPVMVIATFDESRGLKAMFRRNAQVALPAKLPVLAASRALIASALRILTDQNNIMMKQNELILREVESRPTTVKSK